MEYIQHPKQIQVGEYTFQVTSLDPLTDNQAVNVVRHHCLTHKLKKKDRGKIITIITVLDRQSARLFGD